MKKVLKSSLSFILAFIMILSSVYVGLNELDFSGLFAVEVKAASSGTCGTNVTWSLTNNVLKISGTGTMKEYSSCSSVPWYYSRTNIKTVVVEPGVTSISGWSFYKCTNLTSATIGDSVTSVGDRAFYDCINLASIKIPDSVTSIGTYAFDNCSNLTSVTIGSGVASIGDYAFYYCTSLNAVYVTDITRWCDISFGNYYANPLYYAKKLYLNSKLLTDLVIPDDVTRIREYAFYYCTSLTSVSVSDSVKSIGDSAFRCCTKLTSVTISDCVTNIGDNAFSYCTSLISIMLPSGLTSIGSSTFYGCSSLVTLIIPDSVASIGDYSFYGCSKLASVEIPNTLTSIGSGAFSHCTSLISVRIPGSVTSIGSSAFSGCISLTSINVNENNPTYSSFDGILFNKNKTDLIQYPAGKTSAKYTVPNNVNEIGEWAFDNCINLTSIIVPDSVRNINDYAFYDCINLTSISIPDSVTSIGYRAFFNCSSLISVKIPDSITNIDNAVFSHCTSLASISIPDSVTSIGYDAFRYCSSLTSVTIPVSVTSIGDYAFSYCTSLTSITIPNGVKTIPYQCFYGCTSLISITIPDRVTSVGNMAFCDCTSLAYVFYNGSQDQWQKINIGSYNNSALINAKVHYNATGHTLSEWIIDENATCTTNGLKYKECTCCGEILKTVIISATGHKYVTDFAVVPTCTTNGLTEGSHCSVCDSVILEQNIVPATGHTESAWITDINPTCTGKGSKYKTCTVCKTILERAEISANGHTTVTDEAVAPTCTETGLTEGSHCSVCNAVIFAQNVVSAKGHTVSGWITDTNPTCTGKGSKHKECTVCKTILETAGIPANGHTTVTDKAVAPTCTGTGLTEGSHCSVCNVVIVAQSVVSAKGHTVSGWITDTYPTCTGKGSKHKECTVCKTILETAEISANGHTAVTDEAVAPTCTETGLTEGSHCSVCHRVLVAQSIVTAKGHTVVTDKAIAPTCTETGLTEGSHCSVCHSVLVAQSIVSAKGHTESGWIIDTSATCSQKGSKHKECTVCGERTVVADIPIDSTNHNYTDWVTEKTQTCASVGKRVKLCVDCGDTVYELIPAIGHTKSDWIIDSNATCTKKGSKHKECTECKEVLETVEIPATGHTKVTDKAVAPTCTTTGKTEGSHCSVCNTVIKDQTIVPAKGHTVSDWIIEDEPTCEDAGYKYKECTECGEFINDSGIPATGHTKGSWVTDKKATVNAAGSKHKECTECGKTLETAKIAQLKPGRTTVKATTTSTGVKITWSKVTGADKYTVYRKTGDGSYKALKTVTGTSYTDTTAKSGTKYKYNVKAKNEAGYGEYAKSGVTKLFLATPKVTVSNASTGVTVKWNKITGAKGYYVYRKLSGSDSWTKIATVKSGSTVSYTDKKASAGKKYYYTVKAYNGDYVSTTKASSIIEFLKAPTIKSVTSGKSGVTVKWAKATGADGYYVYRKTGSGSYTKIATVKGNTKVSYVDKTAKKGKTYTYYVKAYSGSSVSVSSKALKIKDNY